MAGRKVTEFYISLVSLFYGTQRCRIGARPTGNCGRTPTIPGLSPALEDPQGEAWDFLTLLLPRRSPRHRQRNNQRQSSGRAVSNPPR